MSQKAEKRGCKTMYFRYPVAPRYHTRSRALPENTRLAAKRSGTDCRNLLNRKPTSRIEIGWTGPPSVGALFLGGCGVGDCGRHWGRRGCGRSSTANPAGDAQLLGSGAGGRRALRDGAADVPVSSARWRRRPLPAAAAAAAAKNGAGVGEGRGGAGVPDVCAGGLTWRMRRGQTWPWRRGRALAVAAGEKLDRSGGDGDWWWRRGLSLSVAAGAKLGVGGRREALDVASERGLSVAAGGALRRLLRAGASPWRRGRKLAVAAVEGLEVASGGVLGGGGQRGHGG